ncbi:MAG: cyclic nucleotide-binding domain-containing protein [Acidobacteria bacterium]|nr:cyclic nucleotide-binding domain-containing protein [Acidobacteriota bacterium]MBI3423362.1 cyclic nucleotide-binding domain-containing protein [Acidobacteriota bacterium]
MPTEQTSRREVINAIQSVPSIASLLDQHEGHYDYELDLEVVVYGRNYNGKKVGPYVRLLDYQPGESIVSEGEWGGNTFHIIVAGQPDVMVGPTKVAALQPGTMFGQMSLLAGVPRNATVKAPAGHEVQVLEVQRPALRLLRKLSKFAEELDEDYRVHGRDAMVEELKARFSLSAELAQELKGIARFRTFPKNHVLARAGAPVSRIYLIKTGWLQRSWQEDDIEQSDFLGGGYCFGLDAATGNVTWPCTLTLLGRTEVFEISVVKLRQFSERGQTLFDALSGYAPPALETRRDGLSAEVKAKTHTAQRDLIETGLVDATNLLVMDMDLCVRCGNCSLACHRTHGQSRLVRRGVHITRLKQPTLSAVQSVLSPEVCMHCKDPECLTGCPTGAIERLRDGQIDINQGSCIGCGDCATQCPYDAITMIPRAKKGAAKAGAAGKLIDLLRLPPEPLPPAVETLDDLVAVKCNLCSDRKPLNPPGSQTQKYSCEENCPTGALARINPREYFSEISQLEGKYGKLTMTGPHQAVGQNIHLRDWPKRLLHILGIGLTLVTTLAAWYGIRRYELGQPLVGFLNMRWLTGLAGLFGIVGVMLYPYRRVIYTRRAGALRYWLLTHTYLGVIAAIQLFLHGGNHAGGLLTRALMLAFDGVILTGVFGIFCYVLVPRLLTKIEGAPLLLDDLLNRHHELQQELAALAAQTPAHFSALITKRIVPHYHSLSFLLRQYLRREPLDELTESAKQDWTANARKAGGQVLRAALKRADLLDSLETALKVLREPQSEQAVLATFNQTEERHQFKQALEEVRLGLRQLDQAIAAAVALGRLDALIYLQRSLKLWLPPHVGTTALMLALLVVHIIQVIYFAAR